MRGIEELDGEGIDAVFLYPTVTLACVRGQFSVRALATKIPHPSV